MSSSERWLTELNLEREFFKKAYVYKMARGHSAHIRKETVLRLRGDMDTALIAWAEAVRERKAIQQAEREMNGD